MSGENTIGFVRAVRTDNGNVVLHTVDAQTVTMHEREATILCSCGNPSKWCAHVQLFQEFRKAFEELPTKVPKPVSLKINESVACSKHSLLKWLRDEIDRYQYDEYPVQNVLDVRLTPTFGTTAQESIQLYHELQQTLTNVNIRGVQLEFVSSPSPTLYYTRTCYMDIVKAIALKRFFEEFNSKICKKGNVRYYFSRPLDYLANSTFKFTPTEDGHQTSTQKEDTETIEQSPKRFAAT